MSVSQSEPAATADADREGGVSLVADIKALVEDGRTLVEAEWALQSARATYALNRGKSIAVLLIGAVFFVFFALMALVVGRLMSLAPLLTPWGATALVTLVLAALAGTCFYMAVSRFRTAQARLTGKDPAR
jgi:uncharacterized integral membrane protein